MKGVIWTDVFQGITLIGGTLAVVIMVKKHKMFGTVICSNSIIKKEIYLLLNMRTCLGLLIHYFGIPFGELALTLLSLSG